MNRRRFLQFSLGGMSGFLLNLLVPKLALAARDYRTLKITAVEIFPLKTNSIFVFVRTNEGITGYGECSPMNARVIVSMLKESTRTCSHGKEPARHRPPMGRNVSPHLQTRRHGRAT